MTQPSHVPVFPDSWPADRRCRAEESLRQASSSLLPILETLSAPFFLLDREWRFIYLNRCALAEAGAPLADVLGRSLWEQFPHWLGSPIETHYRQAMTEKVAVRFDLHGPRTGRWFAMHIYPWPDGLTSYGQDITGSKQAEETLRGIRETGPAGTGWETYQTLQSLIHASPLAIATLDCGDNLTMWNPAAERIFGWSAAEVLGGPLPFIPPDKQEEYLAFRASELRGESRIGSEIRRLRKDGSLVDISLWTAPVRDSHGAICSTIGILADITESKRAQEQLQENAERLRVLSRRLLEVQELERRHLARELHDEIGQILTGLQYTLETSLRLEGEELRASLGEGQRLIKDLTARVRDLSLRLRPTMLDDLGLLPALLWHLERYSAQTRIHVLFEQRGLERRLHPPEVETAAYRIVQEALTNIARHAGVQEAMVRLWRDQDRLVIQIEDQGCGFDPRAVLTGASSSGLSGMQERAVLLGGRCTVVSTPGTGTWVRAELPVQGMEERRRRAFNARRG
jgi:PAS domain S-box-containing protein